jgi:hypothetical protein
MQKLFLAALSLGAFSLTWGDTLLLKDGTRHTGTFISGTSTTITFRDEGGVRRRFALTNVDSVGFGSASTLSSSTSSSSTLSSQAASSASSSVGTRDRRRVAQDLRSLPAGTELEVRTNQDIDSETAAEGRSFSAQVEREVRDSAGNVIIPRGSEAELIVAKVEDSGTLNEAELMLDIRSVTIDGRRYLINTSSLEQSSREGVGKNRRTAEMVGGGAAIGTVIGAIAGGGKGALLGAIIGAVGGGAAQVLTKGKRVRVPAESVLTFKLDQAVQLEAARSSLR